MLTDQAAAQGSHFKPRRMLPDAGRPTAAARMTRSGWVWVWTALLAAALAAALPDSASAQAYIRGGILLDRAKDTRLQDKNCSSTESLFGCGNEEDEPEGSFGEFGTMTGWEVGIGYPVVPALRLELAVQYRPEFSFEGRANFDNDMLGNLTDSQDVSAELSLWSGLLAAYLDIPLPGFALLRFTPINPFLGVGAGLSRIEISDIRMELPAAAQSLIVPGDHQVGFSWMLTVGVGVSLARWAVDLAWRHTDHGDIETGAGIGRRVCYVANCRLPDELPLDPTVGELTSQGFSLSLRYSF